LALCSPKTLRGIFGTARNLGLDIENLREMVEGGSLSKLPEAEAADLWARLRASERGDSARAGRLWRLYSSSTLAREIRLYRDGITWGPGGFAAWLKKYFGLERLEWVNSQKKAIGIKNALKRMYNQERKNG